MNVRHLSDLRNMPSCQSTVRLTGGYYDLYRIHELRNELFDLVPRNGVVTVDLLFTQHVECACLGAMIHKIRELETVYGPVRMKLTNVNSMMLRAMSVIRLTEKFLIG